MLKDYKNKSTGPIKGIFVINKIDNIEIIKDDIVISGIGFKFIKP